MDGVALPPYYRSAAGMLPGWGGDGDDFRPRAGLYSVLEHSNSRFESNRFDSLCESIRIDSFSKK